MNQPIVNESRVDTEFGQIAVKIWSPSSGSDKPPIVLLHDSLGSIGQWRDFPALLCEVVQHPVIAYDRLGFGQSDARDELPTLDFVAQEAQTYFPQIKRGLGLRRYIVFGHSVGGAMAVEIAASDTECVAVITLAAQAYVQEKTLKSIDDARTIFADDGQFQKLAKWHNDKARWVLHAWTDVWLHPGFAEWHITDALNSLQCPILAIHGADDEYGSVAFPEYICQEASGLSYIEVIEDCAHVPHKTHTAQVFESVKAFIESIESLR